MSATSAAQPGFIDTSTVLADAASALQPGGLPAARWLSKLHALGLHVRPVEGKDVFSYTSAKSILKESLQEAVLRKFGAYEPLQLCYQATKPWKRFFIFDKDFVAYDRTGMRAEDPNAHKWSASKLWIDYTPYVNAIDWTQALRERCSQDAENLKHLLRERKRDQGSSPRKCTCGPGGGSRLFQEDLCTCKSNDITEKICHDDAIDPNSCIWDWYVKEHSHDVALGVLGGVRAALTGTWLQRKFQFLQATSSWIPQSYPSNCIWNLGDFPLSCRHVEPTKYSKYLLRESSQCFYRSDLPGWSMPLLLWAGGTYARRPEDFPKEQSSAAWLEDYLLPLDLKTPRFKWHQSLEDLAKTWSSAKWHGKAPHPYAIKEPFPYASASMRSHCRFGYTDAKNVSRQDPWRNFQR